MKLDELTFEIKTKSGEYRPCLVADMKALFHIWTPEGKAIVEFDDGTVSTIEAEDIRFLDTESIMLENACFSDEYIECFKKKSDENDSEIIKALDEWNKKYLGIDKLDDFNIGKDVE